MCDQVGAQSLPPPSVEKPWVTPANGQIRRTVGLYSWAAKGVSNRLS